MRSRRTGRSFHSMAFSWSRSPTHDVNVSSTSVQPGCGQVDEVTTRSVDEAGLRCGLVGRGRPFEKLVGIWFFGFPAVTNGRLKPRSPNKNNTNNGSGGLKCRRTLRRLKRWRRKRVIETPKSTGRLPTAGIHKSIHEITFREQHHGLCVLLYVVMIRSGLRFGSTLYAVREFGHSQYK